jgi:hypothetical protein
VTTALSDQYSQNGQLIDREAEKLYTYFLDWVQQESPAEVLARFRRVFIEANPEEKPEVLAAVAKIGTSQQAEQGLHRVLERCCQILIAQWQKQGSLQAIPELVGLCEQPLSVKGKFSSRQRLGSKFTQTEQYLKLKRLARIISPSGELQDNRSPTIGDSIAHYPYLYQHCLIGEDSAYDFQRTIRKIQAQVQKQFEVRLVKYFLYRERIVQLIRSDRVLTGAENRIQPADNPTLLGERELDQAVKQFGGAVEAGKTYRELAHQFLAYSLERPSYQAFKADLPNYLVSGWDSGNKKESLKGQLTEKLKQILPHCDSQAMSELLLLRTTSQLLNFLVVDSPKTLNHYLLVTLIANMGGVETIGLLMKLVLLCPLAKPHLEKRFLLLFEHYEASSPDKVIWLLTAMENLQIAFSVNFGKVDLGGVIDQLI